MSPRIPAILALAFAAVLAAPSHAQLFGQGAVPDVSEHSRGARIDVDRLAVKGKVTIVDFYSRSCLPCMKKKPKLERLARAHPNIVVRFVDVDPPGETSGWDSPVMRQYLDQRDALGNVMNGLPWIRLYDDTGKLKYSGEQATAIVDKLIADVLGPEPRS